jgi:DNA-binding GntR family transcriptional regulator
MNYRRDCKRKNVSYLKMPSYLYSLILPKCNIVLGSYFTSIYFQLYLNICHDTTLELWKHGKCWKSQETLSKTLHCSRQTINKVLNYLIELKLISKSKRQLHNVYELMNNDITDEMVLFNFNSFIEDKLLTIAGQMNKDTTKIADKFKILNDEVAFHKSGLKKFLSERKLYDTRKIRREIEILEKDNQGITIFYLNDVLTTNNHKQKYKAIRDGISQSSVSRYMTYCEERGILNTMNEKVEKKKEFECPICKNSYDTNRSLCMHISKTKENNHILLNKLRQADKEKSVMEVYLNNQVEFTEVEVPYKNIQCENCSGNCRLCYKEFKEEFKACKQDRKEAFVKQEQMYIVSLEKKEKAKVAKAKQKKKDDPNSVGNLMKYFYNKTETLSPSFSKECGQLKNLLNKGYTGDEIRITMDYLIDRKNVDLRFINRSIEEALVEQKYKNELNILNTAPYLVNLFHTKLGVNLNMFNLVKESNKIQQVLDAGYTPLDIKKTIKYMQHKEVKVLNYIPNMIEEALDFYAEKSSAENDSKKIEDIVSELRFSMTSIENIEDKYKDTALKCAEKIFIDKSYFKKDLTKFEWAYSINLSLTKDLIKDGIAEKNNKKWLCETNNCNYSKEDFLNWLKKQFEKNNIEYVL